MKRSPETALVKACLQYLAMRKVLAWRNNSGALRVGKRFVRFGAAGSADILGLLPANLCPRCPGRFLAVECKVRPNKPTAAQEAFLEAIRCSGGIAVVVYSLEDLQQALEEI